MRVCAALCVVAAVAGLAACDRAAQVSVTPGRRLQQRGRGPAHSKAFRSRHHSRGKLHVSSTSFPASFNPHTSKPLPPPPPPTTPAPPPTYPITEAAPPTTQAQPFYETTHQPTFPPAPTSPATNPAATTYPATTPRASTTTTTTKPPHPPHRTIEHHDPLYDKPPACSYNTTNNWCQEDAQYPLKEVQRAAQKHSQKLLALYADVADLSTPASVAGRPQSLQEETYLCRSSVAYVKPLRAVSADGRWRIVVNGAAVHYDTLTQTARVERCAAPLQRCPLVPACYQSACLQQTAYHRLLVWDPSEPYFPFAIHPFPLPSSCSCAVGQYTLSH